MKGLAIYTLTISILGIIASITLDKKPLDRIFSILLSMPLAIFAMKYLGIF